MSNKPNKPNQRQKTGLIIRKSSPAPSKGGVVSPRTDSTFSPAIPTIAGTAAGLGYDVDNIYAFVANNIEYIPTWGVQKGALGCLIDGTGNAFDQAALMVALLGAADANADTNYNASFLFGSIQLNYNQLNAWLNTTDPSGDGTCYAAKNLLANGGNENVAFPENNGVYTYTSLNIPHVWVQVEIGGSTYVFDTCMKTYNVNAGQNLATIAGYNATNFQNAIVTTTPTNDYFQNLNIAALQTQLATMDASVQSWIASNNPEATVQDLIGGRTIVPVPAEVRSATLSYQQPGTTPVQWTVASGGIPSTYFTTLHVQFDNSGPNGTYLIDQTFNSHDIAASRLTLMPNSSNEFELMLDGTLLGTSSAQAAGSYNSLLLTPTHPFTTNSNQPFYQTIYAGFYYLIGNSWGSAGPMMGYIRRQLLNDNLTAGGASTDEDVIGESLNTLFHHWNAQTCATAAMIGQLNDTTTTFHHQIGMVGHNPATTGGPLTDLGGIAWLTSANDNNYNLRQQPTDLVLSLRSVTFESGTITQVPGVPGVSSDTILTTANNTVQIEFGLLPPPDAFTPKPVPGNILTISCTDNVSGTEGTVTYTVTSSDTFATICTKTVALINANTTMQALQIVATASSQTMILSSALGTIAYSGNWQQGSLNNPVPESSVVVTYLPIYVVNASNWSTGTNVQSLVTGYSTQDLTTITGYVNSGQTLIVHQNGAIFQNLYQGYGYFVYQPGPVSGGCRGIITGGLNGGGSDEPLTITQNNTNSSINLSAPDNLDRVEIGEKTELQVDFNVDHLTGNLTVRHTDLDVGGKEFPYSLPFTRFFNNKNVATVTECGRTWSHNYYITATIASSPYAALGQQTGSSAAYNAIGTLIALLQTTNNFNVGSSSNVTNNMGFIISYITANQLTKLLTNNVVNISMGDRTYTFTQLSNGSYAPPKGVSMTLTKTPNYFVMEDFDGTVYQFTNWAQNTTRIASIAYTTGVVITFSYTGSAPEYELSKVSNNLGRSLTFSYKLISGLVPYLESIVTDSGLTATYTFDPLKTGNLLSTVDGGSITTNYTYDSKYRMLSYQRLGTYTVTYNAQNQVVTMTNPLYETGFAYASAGQGQSLVGGGASQSSASGGPSGTVTNIFNSDGQPITTIVGTDVTEFQYDALGRTILKTLPYGDALAYSYDQFNRVLTQVHAPLSETFQYNNLPGNTSWNKWTTHIDPNGKVWQRTYNSTGTIATETDPVGGVKQWSYGSFGLLTGYSDPTMPTPVFTSYTNQSTGEVTQAIVNPGTGNLNLTSNYGYNANGDRTSSTNPNGNTTGYVYNSSRWRTQMTEPAPFSLQTNYAYDLIGDQTVASRQTGFTPANQTTTTTYTPISKPQTVVDPLGNTTQFGYDQLGRRTSTLDAQGNLRQYVLDVNGRLTQIIDSNGVAEETRSLYPGGLVHTIEDARSNISTFIRDNIGRLIQITYPDNSTEKWTLDDNGNVTSFQTRDGKTLGQTFDGCNRVLTRSPQNQPTVTMTYDLAGRLTSASTPVVTGDPSTGNFSRGYDSAGRLVSESSPNQSPTGSGYDIISYQLDANGNVLKITYPSGYYVTRTYDQLDRVTGITLNGATKPAATFSYDGLDRRTELAFNNGAVTDYSYDIGNNRLRTDIATGGADISWKYEYNNVHQVINKLTYDSTYEWLLSTASSINYGAANDLNAYPTVGGTTQTYDTAGRLTNDGTFSYVYNTEGMLTEVQNASGSAVVATYSYDPFKRQAQKIVNSPSTTTRYVYSGSQLMEEYNCSAGLPGTLIRRYVYASPGEAIFQIDVNGNVTYLHQDHQGSLIAQANASGTVLNKYTYSPYGENTGLPGSVIGYTGQRYDSETGLYYYKARHYKPSIGRFLQPDPLGYAPGMNMYGYVHNDRVP